MDDLQYMVQKKLKSLKDNGFKPCYKWMTFNTKEKIKEAGISLNLVLNLVING